MSRGSRAATIAGLALVAMIAGCGKKGDGGDTDAPGGKAPPPTFVDVAPVKPGATLDGVWLLDRASTATPAAAEQSLSAAGQQAFAASRADTARHWDGTARCLPPGLPRLLAIAKPMRIVTGKHLITMLFQDQRLTRYLALDQAYAANPDPSYLGNAVAHWEGPALVVDTDRFKDGTRLDEHGLPHGPGLKLNERIALTAPDTLVDTVTVTDPDFYAKPWTWRLVFRRSGEDLTEEVCADDKKLFAR